MKSGRIKALLNLFLFIHLTLVGLSNIKKLNLEEIKLSLLLLLVEYNVDWIKYWLYLFFNFLAVKSLMVPCFISRKGQVSKWNLNSCRYSHQNIYLYINIFVMRTLKRPCVSWREWLVGIVMIIIWFYIKGDGKRTSASLSFFFLNNYLYMLAIKLGIKICALTLLMKKKTLILAAPF